MGNYVSTTGRSGQLVLAGTGIAAVALAWKFSFSKRPKRIKESRKKSNDSSVGKEIALIGVIGLVFVGALIALGGALACAYFCPIYLSESKDERFTNRRPPQHLSDSRSLDEICDSGSNAQREIKIMTYNLWGFGVREEVFARMHAVTQLVQDEMPDVVLFQEVTPSMREVLLSQMCQDYKPFWFEENKCIMFSRLRTMVASLIHFTTGGELLVIETKLHDDKDLFIATSHLKGSRVNCSKEKKDQDRKIRMSQAQEAIKILGHFQNIIFGGDMNWNKKDGKFPNLENGWIDAWVHLKPPQEPGCTFDVKNNPLLKGRKRKLQERLDRFLCKLKDFELVNIKIVGTKEIQMPNQTVMISDHYGLILTIRI